MSSTQNPEWMTVGVCRIGAGHARGVLAQRPLVRPASCIYLYTAIVSEESGDYGDRS